MFGHLSVVLLTNSNITGCLGSAGLFATQAAARAEGNPEAAAKSKVGQMFNTKSPLAPFVEPLTMYYQVRHSYNSRSMTHQL